MKCNKHTTNHTNKMSPFSSSGVIQVSRGADVIYTQWLSSCTRFKTLTPFYLRDWPDFNFKKGVNKVFLNQFRILELPGGGDHSGRDVWSHLMFISSFRRRSGGLDLLREAVDSVIVK